MARTRALPILSASRLEWARTVIVLACASALILAGRAFPF